MNNKNIKKINYIKCKSCVTMLPVPHPVFRIEGVLNPYSGCPHNCVYCQFSSVNNVAIKTDFVHMIEKKLSEIDKKLHLGFGTNTEPYSEIEEEYNITRHALEIVTKHEFPLQIFTKSGRVLRDIDLLRKYSKMGLLAVNVSIPVLDASLAEIIEPGVPPVSERIKMFQELKKNDVFGGILISPIMPFINDTKKQLEAIFKKADKINADYVIPLMLCMKSDIQKKKIMTFLSAKYPGLTQKYEDIYQEAGFPKEEYTLKLNTMLLELSKKYEMPMNIPTENVHSGFVSVNQEMCP